MVCNSYMNSEYKVKKLDTIFGGMKIFNKERYYEFLL